MTQSLENPFFIGRVDGDILWIHGIRFGSVDYSYRFERVP